MSPAKPSRMAPSPTFKFGREQTKRPTTESNHLQTDLSHSFNNLLQEPRTIAVIIERGVFIVKWAVVVR